MGVYAGSSTEVRTTLVVEDFIRLGALVRSRMETECLIMSTATYTVGSTLTARSLAIRTTQRFGRPIELAAMHR
jgi:hypothetical protein